MSEFLPHLERVRELRLMVNYDAAVEVFAGREFPLLEELHLEETEGEVEVIDLFSGPTVPPRLQILEIAGISLGDWNAPFIFGLQHLSIHLTRTYLPRSAEIILILESSLALVTFSIAENDSWVEPLEKVSAPRTIPSLKRLKLDLNPGALYSVLASIRTPNVTEIVLAHGSFDLTVDVTLPGRGPISTLDFLHEWALPLFAKHSHATLGFEIEVTDRHGMFWCWILDEKQSTRISELRFTCTLPQVTTAFICIGKAMKHHAESMTIKLKTMTGLPHFLREVQHRFPLLPPITCLHLEAEGPSLQATLDYLGLPTLGLPDLESLYFGSQWYRSVGLGDRGVLNLIQQRYGRTQEPEPKVKPLKKLAFNKAFTNYSASEVEFHRTLESVLGGDVIVQWTPYVSYIDSIQWLS